MIMIDHLEANLNLIIAEPDNIAARLVYADQLDEVGESERAEFIRGQIAGLNCDDLLRVNEWKWTPKFLQRLLNDRTRRLVDLGWHNGFIEQITVTATFAWTGGPCCHDTVVWKADPIEPVITNFPQKDCKLCHGRGYIGGIGWDAVKQTPVRVVRVVDRRPLTAHGLYIWGESERRTYYPSQLPPCIFRKLAGAVNPDDWNASWCAYESEDAAYAALSQALIEFVGGRAKQVK